MTDFKYKLGVLGFGNMAEAITKGFINNRLIDAQYIVGSTPRAQRRAYIHQRYGVRMFASNSDILNSQIVLLAVKPQKLQDCLVACHEELLRLDSQDIKPIFISIAAGISIKTIAKYLPKHSKIIRAMPNLPIIYGESVTALSKNKNISAQEFKQVETLFESVGSTYTIKESKMNAMTAFAGSGPAFIFKFIEEYTKAGIKAGLTKKESELIATQTFLGSAKLLAKSPDTAQALCEKVCSPGGTSLAGLAYFKKHNLNKIIEEVILAAKNRAEELES